ncbi:MAG: LON peptidase substrate-binding domain-containing protein [Xanthobacteraceae bacterium]|nr:LON peptidase substrate-binding domain-containing protein [Xanthobacteraceae bacterium]
MRDFRDAKAMAQTLRDVLKQKSVSLTNSESLELIAKILGFHDWNVLSAKIQSSMQSEPDPTLIRITTADERPAVPLPEGADLPLVPMRDLVLFPHMIAPLFIGREKTRRAIDCAMAADKRIVAVTQCRAGDDDPIEEALYSVGVIASVIDFMPLADGTLRIIVKSLERVRLTRCIAGEMLAAKVASFAESRGDVAQAAALARTVLEGLRTYLNTDYAAGPYSRLPHIREPGVLADMIAPLMPIEIGERQDLLETGDAMVRLEKILALMKNDRRAA